MERVIYEEPGLRKKKYKEAKAVPPFASVAASRCEHFFMCEYSYYFMIKT